MTLTRRRAAAPLLIAVPALFTGAFALLASRFDYPDVLRQPAGDVLTRFHRSEDALMPLWWAMLCAALLFVPASYLGARAVGLRGSRLTLAAVFGALAGFVQAMGLSRWVFLVPLLADRYADPGGTEPTRRTALLLFEAFHAWAGAGIGEWFGYLFTALWTLLVASALWEPRRRRWVSGGLAAVSAVGILAGMLEPFGVPGVGAVNAVAYLLWSLWMIVLGISLAQPGNRADDNTPKGNTMTPSSLVSKALAGAIVLIATIAIVPARAQSPETPATSRRQVYLHAFRSPSIGAEYRTGNVGVHAGLYTTILGSGGKSTEFLKVGTTGYFGGRPDRRYEGFFSLAYVRGLNRDYEERNGVFLEPGIRYALTPRIDFRLGAGVLLAEGNKPRVNPTIGVSWRIPLR